MTTMVNAGGMATFAHLGRGELTGKTVPGGYHLTMTYDSDGNETAENAARSRTTFAYDNENRLVSIAFAGGTRSTYTYAGDGLRRSAFEAGGVLTTFIWDGDDYLGEE